MKEVQTISEALPAVREAIKDKTTTICETKRYESYSGFAPIVRQAGPTNQTPEVLKNKYGDLDRFLAIVSPKAQPAFARKPEMAVNGDYPTLQEINACYGMDFDVEWLTVQICDMSTFTGAKNMDENQQEVLARTIAAEYPGLKVTELLLFFHRFKTGRYGHFYGNVDPMVVTTALLDFIKERNDLRDAVNDMEAEQWKQYAADKTSACLDEILGEIGLTSDQLYVSEVNGYQHKVRISTDSREVFDSLREDETKKKMVAITRQHLGDDVRLVIWLNLCGGYGVPLTE